MTNYEIVYLSLDDTSKETLFEPKNAKRGGLGK